MIFDICIALYTLPPYVLLWIVDCLPNFLFVSHAKKIHLIQNILESIRRVYERRSNKSEPFERPPKRMTKVTLRNGKVKVFTIPPAAWIHTNYLHLNGQVLYAEFVKNCTLFYWERFGQLIKGDVDPILNDSNDVEKSLCLLEKQIGQVVKQISLFGRNYQVTHAVVFLYLYSKIRQFWSATINSLSKKSVDVAQKQYCNDITLLRDAIIAFETQRHLLPGLAKSEKYVDEYFETDNVTPFRIKACLHIYV